MSLLLPPPGSPLRELFDIPTLVCWNSLPTFPEAKRSARWVFEDRAVADVFSCCIRANGNVELVRFGPKGGHKTLWNFGSPV